MVNMKPKPETVPSGQRDKQGDRRPAGARLDSAASGARPAEAAPEAAAPEAAGSEARPAHFDFEPADAVLEVQRLSKHFPVRRQPGRTGAAVVKAVDGVSFQLKRGEILGLVGESGCGKTTTGKLIMKLLEPSGGSIRFDGAEVTAYDRAAEAAYRRLVQMIFQDPYASMNPRFRIRDVLEEPLLIHKLGSSRAGRLELIRRVLEKVKITPVEDYLDRHPHMLSGGQRQRVATARTLILAPRVIVADEPVSMIDLSTRAEILHLLRSIQKEMELSFLYITHDISTARYFTDRIAVMYLGTIVEIGGSDAIIDRAAHPYTRALIAAVCEPEPGKADQLKELPIRGEIPSAADMPPGCRFHPRCPQAMDICKLKQPGLTRLAPGHYTSCWLHGQE
jgi:peptide/nickel transport system ATP-binding protein